MFQDRRLIIATKHAKERVIAPLLEKALGVHCFVDETFDTDMFGTFSGEIARTQDPIATARKKCLKAMELANCDLGIASEGSFGPHPTLFFVNADDEFLIFIDRKNNLEIIARELSTNTNFNGQEISSEKQLLAFAKSVSFPTHGLMLRKKKEDNTDIIKGITDINHLKEAFKTLFDTFRSVYAETDMRAMHNPTRLEVIKTATQKLLVKINSRCPQCSLPGFGVTNVKKGLACSLCGSPTQSTLSHLSVCQHCTYTQEELYPHNKTAEEPLFCDRCNP